MVNRKYQRKLVWSIEEKQELIRSLMRGYPIPLILFAKYANSESYEIIDGMQRLDAICGFLENQFPVDGKYFNVSQNPRTRAYAESGEFKPAEGPFIDNAECTELMEYEVPVSVFGAKNEEAVTEVFQRINSGGKHLSAQESRQAGVMGKFPDLVRRLAAEFRGDVSLDTLKLREMPTISIDKANGKLNYGVHAEDTFWVASGVLNTKQLRESNDEEFIADLLISILDGRAFAASKTAFDKAYDLSGTRLTDLETKLNSLGSENLERNFKSVMSLIRENLPQTPKAFQQLVRTSNQSNPCKSEFYAVFMACYRLTTDKQMFPSTAESFQNALRGLSDSNKKQGKYQTTDNREKNIRTASAALEEFFVRKDCDVLTKGPELTLEVENSLRRSSAETARYECKQGLLSLDQSRNLNEELLRRIPKTLAAIANLGPGESPTTSGYFFIGVADRQSDADRIRELDGVHPQTVSKRQVVGIDREIERLGEDTEKYVKRIATSIQKSTLPKSFTRSLLGSIDVVDFRGMEVIRIAVPVNLEPVYFDDSLYVREESSTKEIVGQEQSKFVLDFDRRVRVSA